jgi:OOP family OmpA-OmpF porin
MIMKFLRTSVLFLFLLSLTTTVNAQGGGKKTSGLSRFFKKTPWTFTLGGHVVDDDGRPFSNLFNVAKTWNFLPYPTRLAIDGYYKKGWSFQSEFSFTQYKTNKLINGDDITSTYTFFSADAHVKYDLNELFGDTHWFDPYVAAGYGYNMRTVAKNPNSASANAGLGFNIWVYQNLGFNAQTIAKFSMIEGTSNYLHHSVGIVYRFEYGMGNRPGKLGKRYTFLKTIK